MSESILLGETPIVIRRSSRRKTIGFVVERGGDVVVQVPESCPISIIEKKARDKAVWIFTKLSEKEELNPVSVRKDYISGEGFYYLGNNYRLFLIDDSDVKQLTLRGDCFILPKKQQGSGREQFIQWYHQETDQWVKRKIVQMSDRIGVENKGICVRDLGKRWGSCNKKGIMNFHWRLIMLPPMITEYVIVHEMVHLIEPCHSLEFWKRVRRVLPDYAERKRWLAENGCRYDL